MGFKEETVAGLDYNISHMDMGSDLEKEQAHSNGISQKAHTVDVEDVTEKDVEASTIETPPSDKSSIQIQVIKWKDENDPLNPKNWPASRKWTTTILVSLFTFCTLMTSTLVAPALPDIQRDLDIPSDVQAQLVISSFVLSYALGPFIWAPLSEQYGRLPILQAAGTWYFVWNLLCGFAHNKATMIVGRILAGIGGAGALAIGPGVLSDCWSAAQRGTSLAVMSLIPLLAPAIGPILGGQVAQYSTWRWAFWSTSMFDAAIQIMALLLIRETHGPTILRKQTVRMNKQQRAEHDSYLTSNKITTTNNQHRLPLPPPLSNPTTPLTATFRKISTSLRRPIHLLATQPPIQLTAVWSFIQFGILFIVMSAYATTFETVYAQSSSTASLNYLSLGIGYTIGAQVTGRASDALYKHLTTRHRNLNTGTTTTTTTTTNITHAHRHDCPFPATPELRILPLSVSTVLTTTGLLIYGLTARRTIHWAVPNLGMVLFAAGNQSSTQSTNAYIIDAYADRGCAASAMAGVWALKSLGGFALPLLGPVVQGGIGIAGANAVWAGASFFAGAALGGTLWWYGARLRGWGDRRLQEA